MSNINGAVMPPHPVIQYLRFIVAQEINLKIKEINGS
jgi:hypothetical protein